MVCVCVFECVMFWYWSKFLLQRYFECRTFIVKVNLSLPHGAHGSKTHVIHGINQDLHILALFSLLQYLWGWQDQRNNGLSPVLGCRFLRGSSGPSIGWSARNMCAWSNVLSTKCSRSLSSALRAWKHNPLTPCYNLSFNYGKQQYRNKKRKKKWWEKQLALGKTVDQSTKR